MSTVLCQLFYNYKQHMTGEEQTHQLNPLTPTVAIWVKHLVPDRVKESFVIFDIWAL